MCQFRVCALIVQVNILCLMMVHCWLWNIKFITSILTLHLKLKINTIFSWQSVFLTYWGSCFKQDSENDHIYHSELFTLSKKAARGEPQKLSFTVPIFEPHPPQYYIRAVSDSWLQSESFYTISLHNLALPDVY